MMTSVPDWEFGQVVHFTQDRTALAMVLGWEYRFDANPSESVVILVALTPGKDPINPLLVGKVFKPYCGWWEAVDV